MDLYRLVAVPSKKKRALESSNMHDYTFLYEPFEITIGYHFMRMKFEYASLR